MQFRILGTERSTGQGVAKTVTAMSREGAEAKARAMNVEVMDIQFLADAEPTAAVGAPLYWRPGVAAVLSFFFPGIGQMYKGRIGEGFLWMILTGVGYLFLIPGLIIHLLCVINATTGDPHKHRG